MVESAVDMLTEEAMEPWAVVPWAESWNTTSAASRESAARLSRRARVVEREVGKNLQGKAEGEDAKNRLVESVGGRGGALVASLGILPLFFLRQSGNQLNLRNLPPIGSASLNAFWWRRRPTP